MIFGLIRRTEPGSFAHGIHPEEHKGSTAQLPIERMPFVERYVLPLSQHIGAPARAVVAPGDRVRRGQCIAEAQGFVSTALHSPVNGRISAIGPRRHPNGGLVPSIEIEADSFDSQAFVSPGPDEGPQDLASRVQRAGIVGLGGAAFPAHVKYRVPEGRKVRQLLVNGCECEPYLTCDHRVMLERPDAVIKGVEAVGRALGVEEAVIGVELNKANAIAALEAALARQPPPFPIRVQGLKVKYPQGAEKMLIMAVLGQEVPAGKLPLDLDVVVNNVSTLAAVTDLLDRNLPLVERVLTVAGPGVERPANLLVPIGTPIIDVLRHCGLRPEVRRLVMGGPMMGTPIASPEAPVLKGTSGLLAFVDDEPLAEADPCIRCGRCLEACPYDLNPSTLGRLGRAGEFEEMADWYVMDCMECGACTYACPSRIPIVQLIRAAKTHLRSHKAGS